MLETANTPREKVRQLQRKLYVCAKQSRTRRFHALYDRIYRSDVLEEAWRRVRSNRGAAGIDAETVQAIEQRGADEFLAEITADLRAGRYFLDTTFLLLLQEASGSSVLDDTQGMELRATFEIRFERGTARTSPWCEVEHRVIDWAFRSSAKRSPQ